MIPTHPSNLLSMPFAQNGNYTVTPETTTNSGRASQALGFPPETQRPLNDGGVAPNRLDFNGMFNMLSAFTFWQQSGGQFSYNQTLNYTVPNIVYHNNIMWWCLKDNGPSTPNGLVVPGTDDDYWQEYLLAMADNSQKGSAVLGNPVGTIIHFWGLNAPDGYFACDGSEFSPSSYPQLYEVIGGGQSSGFARVFPSGPGHS